MTPTIPPDSYNLFFAAAPFAILIAILAVAYVAKRHEAYTVPIGQTFACANCRRRGQRDHMVPQVHEGAVSWFCARCAGAH